MGLMIFSQNTLYAPKVVFSRGSWMEYDFVMEAGIFRGLKIGLPIG
jgi:hypothetical protein